MSPSSIHSGISLPQDFERLAFESRLSRTLDHSGTWQVNSLSSSLHSSKWGCLKFKYSNRSEGKTTSSFLLVPRISFSTFFRSRLLLTTCFFALVLSLPQSNALTLATALFICENVLALSDWKFCDVKLNSNCRDRDCNEFISIAYEERFFFVSFLSIKLYISWNCFPCWWK